MSGKSRALQPNPGCLAKQRAVLLRKSFTRNHSAVVVTLECKRVKQKASNPSRPGTALITGASSGIGAVYADRLARRGHDLILVARNAGRLAALSARLRAEIGISVEALPADLTVTEDLRTVENRLHEDGAITTLINCAGLGPGATTLASEPAQLDRMIALNVTALNRLSLAAATAFLARDGGAVVNIASVVALIPERFNGTYAATKAFVLALTQSLAAETVGRGLRWQAVMPGLTRSEIFERAGFDTTQLDPEMMMEAGEMVDAALAGLDAGELVTIPSLPDPARWNALTAARLALAPDLSHRSAAPRFHIAAA